MNNPNQFNGQNSIKIMRVKQRGWAGEIGDGLEGETMAERQREVLGNYRGIKGIDCKKRGERSGREGGILLSILYISFL